jgi:hypothetical protein
MAARTNSQIRGKRGNFGINPGFFENFVVIVVVLFHPLFGRIVMMTVKTKKEIRQERIEELKAGLPYFTGTAHYYEHWLPGCLFTDGVKFLAEKAGAFWMIDLVFSHQPEIHAKARRDTKYRDEFQVWKFNLNYSGGMHAVCDDGDGLVLASQDVEYTDFPLDHIKLYCTKNVDENGKTLMILYLPSEH